MQGEASNGSARVLFTAFEPSGDDHASVVIESLRAHHPEIEVFAWGGPRMERAGATIIERSTESAVMGMPGLAKIREHRQMNRRIDAWLAEHPVAVHVPVDSPAANFPICEIARRRGARVVHLVAPQLWAWGAWRIHKLRRLSDHVLCLLPFEEKWFRERDVPATFIGHPLFDRSLDRPALDEQAATLPRGGPKLALLPGSRPSELRKNFPLLLEAFKALRQEHKGTVGVVAATSPEVAGRLEAAAAPLGGLPEGLEVVAERADAVIHWCDVALVVSGTVTLQIAKHNRPMVIFYRSNPLAYSLLGRWLLQTEFLTLPNLIAGREIVPEHVPHFGGAEPLVADADRLLKSEEAAEQQRLELARVVHAFADREAGPAAARVIAEMADSGVAAAVRG